jgi:hypothetical protein
MEGQNGAGHSVASVMRSGMLLYCIHLRVILDTDKTLSNDSVSRQLKVAHWPPYLLTVEPDRQNGLSVTRKCFLCEGHETCGTGCSLERNRTFCDPYLFLRYFHFHCG